MKKLIIGFILIIAVSVSAQEMHTQGIYGTDFQFINVGIGGVRFGDYFYDYWQYTRTDLANMIGRGPDYQYPYCDVYFAPFTIISIYYNASGYTTAVVVLPASP